jgi:hypothetical protein
MALPFAIYRGVILMVKMRAYYKAQQLFSPENIATSFKSR